MTKQAVVLSVALAAVPALSMAQESARDQLKRAAGSDEVAIAAPRAAPEIREAPATDELSREAGRLYDAVSKSVVRILSYDRAQTVLSEFSQPRDPEARGGRRRPFLGSGSGFVVDAGRGELITNAHVVTEKGRACDLSVVFQDGAEAPASIVRYDVSADAALIRVDPEVLRRHGAAALPAAAPGLGRVGDAVFALGHPFGKFAWNFNAGRVTGFASGFIVSDAVTNPGNSGGPLFNARGEVIGINSRIYTGTDSFAGVSMAIPIAEALAAVSEYQRLAATQAPDEGESCPVAIGAEAASFKPLSAAPARAMSVGWLGSDGPKEHWHLDRSRCNSRCKSLGCDPNRGACYLNDSETQCRNG